MDKLTNKWKSGFSDEIKREFFQAMAGSVVLYGCTRIRLTKRFKKEATRALHEGAACCFEQILEARPYKKTYVGPLSSYQINQPSKMSK